MNTVQTAYINALLADASYVTQIAKEEIPAEKFGARLTHSQADYLAANFTVLDSVETPRTLGSGFDAVVWQIKSGSTLAGINNENAGKIFVSMRGTQGAEDIADDATLATKGIPYDQIRDMVNWWLKSTASKTDNNVVQIKVVDVPGEVIGKTFALDTPTTGTGLLEGLAPITAVNGHSLGGYLATAFTRLFGNGWGVQAVNTFNSAGFSNVMVSNTEGEFLNIANMIGASRGLGSLAAVSTRQTNFYAENGWSVTTNSWGEMGFLVPGFNQYGTRTALYQEEGFSIANHSMYKLTDQLALGAALEKLDPGFTLDKLNTLVKAGSNDMKGSYEGVLDALLKALVAPNVQPLQTSDAGDSDANRMKFHEALVALQAQLFNPPNRSAISTDSLLYLPKTPISISVIN